jgi:hypothetical protein
LTKKINDIKLLLMGMVKIFYLNRFILSWLIAKVILLYVIIIGYMIYMDICVLIVNP